MTKRPIPCWHCGTEVEPASLDYEAVLTPRSAARGGPVLVFSCHDCGVPNVVEKNGAGERLLAPPGVAGLRTPALRGPAVHAARKWIEEHAAERQAFLARTAPALGAGEPEEAPGERPGGADARPGSARPEEPATPPPPADDEDDGDPPVAPREIGSVLAAYEVLDLPLTADMDAIRRRYRELSRKCHPDRVADLDEAIRRTAERRFLEIRRAYELLAKDR